MVVAVKCGRRLDRSSSWWRHEMETFSALLAICAGNSPVPGEFPAQRPVTWSFEASLICVWINGWVNNREAGDLRRYRAHYDVIVMFVDSDNQLELWNELRHMQGAGWSHGIMHGCGRANISIPVLGILWGFFNPVQSFRMWFLYHASGGFLLSQKFPTLHFRHPHFQQYLNRWLQSNSECSVNPCPWLAHSGPQRSSCVHVSGGCRETAEVMGFVNACAQPMRDVVTK